MWPKGCTKAVVECNNYVFILLIYFLTFVPIEDVKIAAVDVKIYKNYIKMHQNWDGMYTMIHLTFWMYKTKITFRCTKIVIQNILYTLTQSTFGM
jgi:hypothetical protein